MSEAIPLISDNIPKAFYKQNGDIVELITSIENVGMPEFFSLYESLKTAIPEGIVTTDISYQSILDAVRNMIVSDPLGWQVSMSLVVPSAPLTAILDSVTKDKTHAYILKKSAEMLELPSVKSDFQVGGGFYTFAALFALSQSNAILVNSMSAAAAYLKQEIKRVDSEIRRRSGTRTGFEVYPDVYALVLGDRARVTSSISNGVPPYSASFPIDSEETWKSIAFDTNIYNSPADPANPNDIKDPNSNVNKYILPKSVSGAQGGKTGSFFIQITDSSKPIASELIAVQVFAAGDANGPIVPVYKTFNLTLGGGVETEQLLIAGGKAPYSVVECDPLIAAAVIDGNVISVTAQGVGSSVVVVQDSSTPVKVARWYTNVQKYVVQNLLRIEPTGAVVTQVGNSDTVLTILGGVPPYQVDGLDNNKTTDIEFLLESDRLTRNGNIITIQNSGKTGWVTIYVRDSVDSVVAIKYICKLS